MASIIKRQWTRKDGGVSTSFRVQYKDAGGVRRFKDFEFRRDAEAYRDQVSVDVRAGRHVADAESRTICEAADA